jgi:hypothetical protein
MWPVAMPPHPMMPIRKRSLAPGTALYELAVIAVAEAASN